MNFLEQLVAEWYSYSGYFVRTNVKANRRAQGGWGNELDVVAIRPGSGELIHVETSWDALTWAARKERFLSKKFVFAHTDYEELAGCQLSTVRKLAIVGGGKSSKSDLNWGSGIEVKLIPQFVSEISSNLRGKNPLNDIVPEGYPRLRAIQFALHFGSTQED